MHDDLRAPAKTLSLRLLSMFQRRAVPSLLDVTTHWPSWEKHTAVQTSS